MIWLSSHIILLYYHCMKSLMTGNYWKHDWLSLQLLVLWCLTSITGMVLSDHQYSWLSTWMVYVLPFFSKAQVTLCRSFFADVPDHSRPARSVMIVIKPSDRGINSRSLSVQDCQYDLSTTVVRHWYDESVWSALSMFATTITTTTDTINTTAPTMLTTTPTLLQICYHD